jgi:hypothetical protein
VTWSSLRLPLSSPADLQVGQCRSASLRLCRSCPIPKPDADALTQGIAEMFADDPAGEWRDHIEEIATLATG